MPERVIYVVRSWPRLSQTFVVGEILALERQGVELAVFAMVRSGEELVQPAVAQVRAPVVYLQDRTRLRGAARLWPWLEVAREAPWRFLSTVAWAIAHPGLAAGYGDAGVRECLGDAVLIARAVSRRRACGERIGHVHAHFAHDPALVGLLTSRLTGLGFTFTAHARDLLQIPASSLVARARHARAVVTCCEANADYIRATVPPESLPALEVVHHGVDLGRFAPRPPVAADDAAGRPLITTVGRLVAKKGFDDLLRALALLAGRGAGFTCRVYGDGPLRDELTRLRDDLGLGDRVELVGARSGDEVVAALGRTDVFALTPRVTDDGDRDGIPNVLVEAMACALPVVTTDVGGVPELVDDGANGLVVPSGSPERVADALAALLASAELRRRLGAAARRRVEDDYDVDAAAGRLRALYGLAPAAERVPS
ncbi:MAG TPA: glycosyltransferase [Pedococcus sp.]